MHVLVTGGAGFIGSCLTRSLITAGHHVTVVDDLSAGDRTRLDGLGDGLDFHRLDVTRPEFVALAERVRPEVLCHLAAQISVRDSVARPMHDAHTNVLGTVNAGEAARAGGSRKLVFASSVATYGMPARLPVSPDAARDPRSPYAAAKLAGETYLHTYRALHGLDYTVLVLANVYGPGQGHEGEAGVVPKFVAGLLHGTRTRLYGDGTQTRDYVYVADVVEAFAAACGIVGGGRRFDIGTGTATSDRELHTIVAKAVGAPDEPEMAPARPGDLPAMVVDPAPAAAGLDWHPATSLPDGIAATVRWARG